MAYTASLFDLEPARSPDLQHALDLLAEAGVEERGAIFTRPEVVAFMLDLLDYRPGPHLLRTRLLEPSCGQGDFLLAAIERLLDAYQQSGGRMDDAASVLRGAIRAVELHHATFRLIEERVRALLLAAHVPAAVADELTGAWLVRDDFLLAKLSAGFTHIVGNPPYVRQERIPDVLLTHYRAHFTTLYDRADLYVPFIERSLHLLAPDGRLAFICADRWMKNRYGGPLRSLVARRFHLEYYVDMTGTDAFHDPVTAYPAIFVLAGGKAPQAATRVVHRPEVEAASMRRLAGLLRQPGAPTDPRIDEVSQVTRGAAPWLFTSSHDELRLLRHLEQRYPTLEAAGCKVGIGVATGCDRVYIGRFDDLPVEPERKLPLVMAPDLRSGQITWSGMGIVNPFGDDGQLVPLHSYPHLAAYLAAHEHLIRARNVARKNPRRWYRTIDRIYPALTQTPKLLVPDIKGAANVVYDAGKYYPHHNLYYVTAGEWDLYALQAVLRSSVAHLFVANYSTRMRGDFLRFQAQYLRRIHLPAWRSLAPSLQNRLRETALAGDWLAANDAAFDVYQIDASERAWLLRAASARESGSAPA